MTATTEAPVAEALPGVVLEARIILGESEMGKINCGDLFMAVGAFLRERGLDPAHYFHEAFANRDRAEAAELLARCAEAGVI